MAELVGQDSFHLGMREALQQGVEEDDALVGADAGEVGVAVGGAARVVDYEDAL